MILESAREGHVASMEEYQAVTSEGIKTDRLHSPPTEADMQELVGAYTEKTRALLYWSDALFNGEQLKVGFKWALSADGFEPTYNEFGPDAIDALIEAFGVEIPVYQPSREFSVSIYVHTDKHPYSLKKLEKITKADEVSFENDTFRFWWD
jgi:hypothetical protein